MNTSYITAYAEIVTEEDSATLSYTEKSLNAFHVNDSNKVLRSHISRRTGDTESRHFLTGRSKVVKVTASSGKIRNY